MAKKKIEVLCTAFRDGFQSVFGARVFMKDYIPAIEAAVTAGIKRFEFGGGALFQSSFFYANENAFENMAQFRKLVGPEIDLQTLSRGVNVVGLESQPRDIINLHAKLFKKYGATTIRNFDALNDVDNLEYSGKCITDNKLKHEIAITMMDLPPGCAGAHDVAFYEKTLREILDSGIAYTSLCFKDASGTSNPRKVHETLKMAKKLLGKKTPLIFHTHETAGISVAAYLAALDAGADSIDLSLAPVSGGTCQPDILTMLHALKGSEYDLGFDLEKIRRAEEVLAECLKDYFVPPEALAVSPVIPLSPMPGGALTANTQMLRDNGILDKYPEIIKAMSEVVCRGGFGTSVTPVSQFYFQQAFNNVMFGPWEKFADGYGKMILGYFGKTPVPPDATLVKLAEEKMKLPKTTEKVLELNEKDENKGTAAAKKMLEAAGLKTSEENIFIAATCKEKGIAFLKGEGKVGVRKIEKPQDKRKPDNFLVTVNGKKYPVIFKDGIATVDGKKYEIKVENGIADTTKHVEPTAADAPLEIQAPFPGTVLKILQEAGKPVAKNEVLFVIEAMKMETEIRSPRDGVLLAVKVKSGDAVASHQVLGVVG
ncbi:oxaloacetate decarboxylase alpha chain [Candidatus Termititenax aidoneus]|uniref:Oxaloacetate decarboxylase alpha chain n=1 Tax=Termititenax aidoneus TaxID=2218524 RepID=A0A388TC37_TERA1|nr:oxaloacetate decarboxylase alpha chain [Candidatus Termititenax aidoneus]